MLGLRSLLLVGALGSGCTAEGGNLVSPRTEETTVATSAAGSAPAPGVASASDAGLTHPSLDAAPNDPSDADTPGADATDGSPPRSDNNLISWFFKNKQRWVEIGESELVWSTAAATGTALLPDGDEFQPVRLIVHQGIDQLAPGVYDCDSGLTGPGRSLTLDLRLHRAPLRIRNLLPPELFAVELEVCQGRPEMTTVGTFTVTEISPLKGEYEIRVTFLADAAAGEVLVTSGTLDGLPWVGEVPIP